MLELSQPTRVVDDPIGIPSLVGEGHLGSEAVLCSRLSQFVARHESFHLQIAGAVGCQMSDVGDEVEEVGVRRVTLGRSRVSKSRTDIPVYNDNVTDPPP